MGDTLRLVPYVDAPAGYLPRQQLPDAWQADGAIFLQRVADLRAQRTFYPAGSLGYRMPLGHGIQIDTAEDLERARHWVDASR
jgi:CMP-N-acetylneuraminic acid synthetase